ncbi:MAG: hypothetical protein Edafosvirus1_54 [Edafosvirus sp.]|uniref:Uncharacterized protein n=1 Tax=Edafosvirus sp. TaxID=2487765 RepID=A0A3G4ZVS4_9VIRU|nr:MAG: hypothetical protein Edafosvirus1_54 [Edafosvirus sp.]
MTTNYEIKVNPEIDQLYIDKKWRIYVNNLDKIIAKYKNSTTNIIKKREYDMAIIALVHVLDTVINFSTKLESTYSKMYKDSDTEKIAKYGGMSIGTVGLSILFPIATPLFCAGGFLLGYKYSSTNNKVGSNIELISSMNKICTETKKCLSDENIIEYFCKFNSYPVKLDQLFDLAMGYYSLPEELKKDYDFFNTVAKNI